MNELIFHTSKNFKKSEYIFQKWKKIDFAIMIVVAIFGMMYLLNYITLNVDNLNLGIILIIISIAFLPTIVFIPFPKFFNTLTLIKILVKYLTKNNVYYWKGIIYEEE